VISAYVKGVGLWTGTEQPPCKVVDSRLGRGTSQITRMAIECVERAGAQASFDLAQIASVFGSALGELEIAIEQLDMMLSEEGIVSPARFKNSVHNTATGVLSIATKNRSFTTALAAGDHTVPATLLEAMLVLDAGLVSQAIAVVADVAPPEPIRSSRDDTTFESLGAAFALDRSADGALAKITLAQNVDGEELVIADAFRHNPCAPALGLLRIVETKKSGTYVLSSSSGSPSGKAGAPAQGWSVRVECKG
jgi:Beta-ketoacyl synthase, N-terminal domain